jgi:integrase
MSVFQRGNIWWYKFKLRGQEIRESTHSASKTLAIKAERERRRQLEEGINHIKAAKQPMIFSVHAKHWLESNAPHWSAGTMEIQSRAIFHLTPRFGKLLLTDITPGSITQHQAARKKAGASNRTINMEVGALRMILRKHRLWANLQPDVKMLPERSDIGRALSADEVHRLLLACQRSRSRSLNPAVLLSIHTGLRNQELRLLRWRQVDMLERTITVGRSKTAGGEGRAVPLSETATACIQEWRRQFPGAKPEHFVFPSERYGFAGEPGHLHGTITPYDLRPDVPIGSWKIAWANALEAAGVKCRWHDLRHTFVSRIAEGQASDATIMALAGHMSVKMKERYSHTRTEAKRLAVAMLDAPQTEGRSAAFVQ